MGEVSSWSKSKNNCCNCVLPNSFKNQYLPEPFAASFKWFIHSFDFLLVQHFKIIWRLFVIICIPLRIPVLYIPVDTSNPWSNSTTALGTRKKVIIKEEWLKVSLTSCTLQRHLMVACSQKMFLLRRTIDSSIFRIKHRNKNNYNAHNSCAAEYRNNYIQLGQVELILFFS